MSAFADWRDVLMPVLPGASTTAVRAAFLAAAATFYKRTRAWQVAMSPFSVVEGTAVLDIDPVGVSDARPVMIEEAYFEAQPITIIHKPRYDTADSTGKPLRIWMSSPTTAVLWPTPNDDYPNAVRLVVSAYPTDPDQLPDFAVTHHYEGIESGTLARMYAQPKAPYTDPRLAELHARKFTAEVQRGKARVSHGNAGLHPVWSFGVVPPR